MNPPFVAIDSECTRTTANIDDEYVWEQLIVAGMTWMPWP